MLSNEQISNLKNVLETEFKRLNDELSELGHGDHALEFDANFADTSQVTAERGELDALSQNLLEARDTVTAALQRIEDGSFGTCTACGEEIPLERLEAMPEASMCIACANKS